MRGIGRRGGMARSVACLALVFGGGALVPQQAQAQDFILGDTTIATDQLLGLCEHACYAGHAAFSTVPYYTLNTPRNVTLVYHEDRAHPMPIITADVRPNGGIADEWVFSATLNGTTVTFTNGDTQIYFQGYSITPLRLAGQFDASTWSNGVYTLVVTVTGMFTSPTTKNVTHTYTTTLVIDNEQNSKVAKGWTIAGVQRLYFSGSRYWITNGDASLAVWSSLGTTAKDFSTLASAGGGDYVRTFVDGSKAYFHSTGLMYKTLNPAGTETDYEYSGSGQLTAIKDPQYLLNGGGRYLSLSYGTYGVLTIRDTASSGYRTTSVSYDANGRLAKIKDPDGDSTLYTYNANGWIETITDRRGGVTTFGYDWDFGKLSSITMPAITVANGSGTMTGHMSELYQPWQIASLSLTASTQWSPLTPWNQSDAIASVQNASGTTTYQLNRYGQPVKITAPNTQITAIAYKDFLPVKITDPMGGVDTLDYANPLSHPYPVYERHSGQGEVDYGYDYTYHERTLTTGPGVAETENRYIGARGRIDSVAAGYNTPTVRMTRFTYDTLNRVLTMTDPHQHVATYHYDPTTGNLDTMTVAGNIRTLHKYDAFGRDTASFASGASAWVQTRYDTLNRMVKNWSATDDTVRTTYDNLFPRLIRAPGGHLYKAEINAMGWVTKRYATDDTAGAYIAYIYNLAGQVARQVDRRGDTVSFAYDNLNRIVSRKSTGFPTDTFTYSSNNRITVSTRVGVATDSTFRNAALALDSIVRRVGGHRFVLHYTYDTVTTGRQTGFNVTSDAGTHFTARTMVIDTVTGVVDTLTINNAWNGGNSVFSYDSDHLLTGITSPSSLTNSFANTAHHTRYSTTVSPASGATRAYTLDSLDRKAQEIAQFSGSGTYTLSAYTFDTFGQLLKIRRTTATSCSVPTDTVFGANTSGCSVASATTVDSSTYDYGGNRSVAGASYSSTGNRLTAWPGYTQLTYDADGNLKTRQQGSVTDTLFWNAYGQLDSLHSGTQRLRYEYTGEGLLAKRSTNGTVDRYFLWDENGHLLAELTGSFGRIAEYVYAPGADLPLAMATDSAAASSVRYYQHDGLGNVIGVTKNGTLQQHTLYGAWGTIENQLVNTLADTNRIRWKGMLYEADSTKLYYVKNRWYDPVIGRFVSEDPVGPEGGLNLYAFGQNDPVNLTDDSGTRPCEEMNYETHLDSAYVDFMGSSTLQVKWHSCTEERFIARLEGKLGWSVGLGGTLILGTGLTGGIGLTRDPNGVVSYYGRLGFGFGGNLGGGLEMGGPVAPGRTDSFCVSIVVGTCASQDAQGNKSRSYSAAKGASLGARGESLDIGTNVERTWTITWTPQVPDGVKRFIRQAQIFNKATSGVPAWAW